MQLSSVNSKKIIDENNWLISLIAVQNEAAITIEGYKKLENNSQPSKFLHGYTVVLSQPDNVAQLTKLTIEPFVYALPTEFKGLRIVSYNAPPAVANKIIDAINDDILIYKAAEKGECEYPHVSNLVKGSKIYKHNLNPVISNWWLDKLNVAGASLNANIASVRNDDPPKPCCSCTIA